MEWLYEHTSGNISVVVSLIRDAQEIAILSGKEVLNLESLNEAYQQRLSMLHGFIQPPQGRQTSRPKKKSVVAAPDRGSVDGGVCIADMVSRAKEDHIDIVELLREHISRCGGWRIRRSPCSIGIIWKIYRKPPLFLWLSAHLCRKWRC